MPSLTKKLKILAPARYPWRFNGPRETVHDIQIRNFMPFNKVSHKIEGITVYNPFPLARFDLIHAFNRIPLTSTPFIISYESHLPRGFGMESTRFFRWMTGRLASPGCRKIIAISQHARAIFLKTHADHPDLEVLKSKLIVHYPNVVLPEPEALMESLPAEPVVITFVGNHFGRKGGCVAVKMAQMALDQKFPLHMNIISTLEVGGAIWTDPEDPSFFAPYLKLLDLPNVTLFQNVPNAQVLDLLRKSHFSLLATFGDTFGYSAIESMVNATPSIATCQGALPEFIEDDINGIVLDLPTDDVGEWKRPDNTPRNSSGFQAFYASEIERLAAQALQRVISVVGESGKLQSLRENARRDASAKFNHRDAARFFDQLYIDVLDTSRTPSAIPKSRWQMLA